jgi:hypothetical protein
VKRTPEGCSFLDNPNTKNHKFFWPTMTNEYIDGKARKQPMEVPATDRGHPTESASVPRSRSPRRGPPNRWTSRPQSAIFVRGSLCTVNRSAPRLPRNIPKADPCGRPRLRVLRCASTCDACLPQDPGRIPMGTMTTFVPSTRLFGKDKSKSSSMATKVRRPPPARPESACTPAHAALSARRRSMGMRGTSSIPR